MSNQTYRDRVKDAGKKRREYLRTKSQAYGLALSGALVSLAFLYEAQWFLRVCGNGFSLANHYWESIAGLLFAATMAAIGAMSLAASHRQVKRAAALPFVPPAREQLAAFHAKEILVRGSDQPAATPEELLRAAQARSEQPAEELLRANSMPTERQS